ncbi:MAG: diaminopimelate epimerase [Syntrophobacterales bacterium]|jgi:diaminopimelate epimerase|nr:diaminopimelate epimerase [Syntrophobacterales bacterium]
MTTETRPRLPFFKMHGGGNDFVIIDHRARFIPEAEQPQFARRVCHRQMSAGADGLILIEACPTANFRWRFYNADGSEPEMCGNGGRCAARFAVINGIAPPDLTFETLAGTIKAEVKGRRVKLLMAGVGDLSLNRTIPLDGETLTGHFLKVGVPHVAVPVTDLEQAPVAQWGRAIRFHPMFAPAGANVNFIRVQGSRELMIRTYERGVEDETLACGTGSVAAVLIAARLGQVKSPVTVHTRGGEALTVYFTLQGEAFAEVFLEGDALVAYQGELWVDELK